MDENQEYKDALETEGEAKAEAPAEGSAAASPAAGESAEARQEPADGQDRASAEQPSDDSIFAAFEPPANGEYRSSGRQQPAGGAEDTSRYPYGAQQTYQPRQTTYGYHGPTPAAQADNRGQRSDTYPYGDANADRSAPYQGARQGYDPRTGYSASPHEREQGQRYAYEETPAAAGGGRKKRSGKKVFAAILAIIAAIVVGAVIGRFAGGSNRSALPPEEATRGEEQITNVDEVTSNRTPDNQAAAGTDGRLSGPEIYRKVARSSVGIQVYNSSKQLISEGTGVLLQEDNDGKYTYIVTCAHVISDRGVSIMVQLYDETEYNAEIVGYDKRTDIGVVRIAEHGLQLAEVGDSTKLVVGETVYAIGNPGGSEFAGSFTNGIISAIDRPVSSSSNGYTMECLQHNAAINPGNSGGGLVNEYGQLVGINSMKIVADDYEGMGFAVPSSVFTEIVNEIVVNGYVTSRAKLGITYIKASQQQAYAMFVAIKGLPTGSIIVAGISEDSDFIDSGLQKGDLITSINGKDLESASDLAAIIEDYKVGDTVKLHVLRISNDYSYEEFDFSGVLVEDKNDTSAAEETTGGSLYDEPDGFGGNGGNGGFGGNGGNGSSGGYDDYFSDFFDDFFNRYYGGNP